MGSDATEPDQALDLTTLFDAFDGLRQWLDFTIWFLSEHPRGPHVMFDWFAEENDYEWVPRWPDPPHISKMTPHFGRFVGEFRASNIPGSLWVHWLNEGEIGGCRTVDFLAYLHEGIATWTRKVHQVAGTPPPWQPRSDLFPQGGTLGEVHADYLEVRKQVISFYAEVVSKAKVPGAAFVDFPEPVPPPSDVDARDHQMAADAGQVCPEPLSLCTNGNATATLSKLAEEDAAKRAQTPAERSLDEGPYVFRKECDYWIIRHEGRYLPQVKDCKGLYYIAYLLARPEEKVPALILSDAYQGQPVSPGNGQEADLLRGDDQRRERSGVHVDAIADQADLESLRRRLKEIEAQFEDVREDRTLSAVERDVMLGELQTRLGRDKEGILKTIAQSTGLGGRPRSFSTLAERARKAVGEAIRRAQEAIRKNEEARWPDTPLWQHLDTDLHLGSFCSYTPRSPIPWSLR